MANYTNSWTDKWGESFSVSDDNVADWIDDDADMALDSASTNTINVTGTVTLDATDEQIGTDGYTFVIANRTIHLNSATDAAFRLNGDKGGLHMVMLNCTIVISEAVENSSNCAMGYASNRNDDFGDSSLDIAFRRSIRTDTGALRSRTDINTWNLINCQLINDHEADNTQRHLLMVSDITDSSFTVTKGYAYRITMGIQGGQDTVRFLADLNPTTGTDSNTGWFVPGNSLGDTSGLNLQRCSYYNANGADQRARELASSDNFSGTEAPSLISISHNNENSTLLISPRFQVYTTEAAASGDNVGCVFQRSGSLDVNGRQILAASFYPRVYTDALLSGNRSDVQMCFLTDINYTDDLLLDIEQLDTAVEHVYTTNDEGYFDGDFDPAFGDLDSSVVFDGSRPFDIPIRTLIPSTADADYTDNRTFAHTAEDYTTVIQIVSLFGTNSTTDTFTWNTDNVDVDLFDSGHYVRRVDLNIIDPDDPHMADYNSAPDITDQFTDTGTPSANDIYALYKYAVQEGDIDYDDYPYPNVSGSVFDAHDATTNDLIIDTSVTNYGVSADGTQFSIQAANLIGDESQTLTKLVFESIDLGGGYVDGLNLGADTISDPLTFSSVQADPEDNFSLKDCVVGSTDDGSATIQVPAPDGDTVYLHLHNVSGNATITRASGGTGSIVVLASGDSTPTLGLTDPNVSELVLLDVTINGADGGLLSVFDADDFSLPIYSDASNTASIDSSAVTELTSGNELVVVWSGAGSGDVRGTITLTTGTNNLELTATALAYPDFADDANYDESDFDNSATAYRDQSFTADVVSDTSASADDDDTIDLAIDGAEVNGSAASATNSVSFIVGDVITVNSTTLTLTRTATVNSATATLSGVLSSDVSADDEVSLDLDDVIIGFNRDADSTQELGDGTTNYWLHTSGEVRGSAQYNRAIAANASILNAVGSLGEVSGAEIDGDYVTFVPQNLQSYNLGYIRNTGTAALAAPRSVEATIDGSTQVVTFTVSIPASSSGFDLATTGATIQAQIDEQTADIQGTQDVTLTDINRRVASSGVL